MWLPAGALLVLAQVVTAPAIGDCEMLDGLKFLAPPGRVTQPVTLAACIVAVLARHRQVCRMARSAVSASLQVFQCSSVWPRSVVWSVRQHDVLSAVAAAPLLLPEQKPLEIPRSARVHRCLHLVGASAAPSLGLDRRRSACRNLRRLQPLRGLLDLMNLKRQFLDARLFQQLELQDIFQGVQVAE